MLQVAIMDRQKEVAVARSLWRRMLQAAAPVKWKKARLSVTVVGNAEILELNLLYTGRSGDTDVLAFALEEGEVERAACPERSRREFAERVPSALGRSKASSTGLSRLRQPAPPLLVGEIIVCASRAAAEARARGMAPETELALYVAHGFLHLLGYDDHTPGDRKRMYAAEERVLKDAGLPSVRNRPRRRSIRRRKEEIE